MVEDNFKIWLVHLSINPYEVWKCPNNNTKFTINTTYTPTNTLKWGTTTKTSSLSHKRWTTTNIKFIKQIPTKLHYKKWHIETTNTYKTTTLNNTTRAIKKMHTKQKNPKTITWTQSSTNVAKLQQTHLWSKKHCSTMSITPLDIDFNFGLKKNPKSLLPLLASHFAFSFCSSKNLNCKDPLSKLIIQFHYF